MAVPSSAQVIARAISYRRMRLLPCPKSWLRAWPSKTKSKGDTAPHGVCRTQQQQRSTPLQLQLVSECEGSPQAVTAGWDRQRTLGTRDQTCFTWAPNAQWMRLTCRYSRCGLHLPRVRQSLPAKGSLRQHPPLLRHVLFRQEIFFSHKVLHKELCLLLTSQLEA